MSKNYETNCPNCGAPLTQYGKCEYCGTIINRPVQFLAVRPGMRKLVCQSEMPLLYAEDKPEKATAFLIDNISQKMADALIDNIKFVTKREFDPRRWEEVITVRGEVWVADSDVRY